MTMDRVRRQIGRLAGGGLVMLVPTLALAAVPPTGEVIGLAVTTFRYAHYTGADDCPQGLALAPRIKYLQELAAPERERLGHPDRDDELQLLQSQGPDGINICNSPTAAISRKPAYPKMFEVQGKLAYGINLDGRDNGDPPAPNTCSHKNFSGLKGEKGIDNQLYRATGCLRSMRWEKSAGEDVSDPYEWGDGGGLDASEIKLGQFSILIEIGDVQDRRNDPHVTVGIYSGRNGMVQDTQGRLLAHTSQTVSDNPRWTAKARGRIKNGVLTTDPVDVNLQYVVAAIEAEHNFRGAQLELTLNADGSARGVLAGYKPIESVYYNTSTAGPGGRQIATDLNRDCPGMYRALYELADGYPDPDTGQCTAISSAHAINAVPVFIFHPKPSQAANTEPVSGKVEALP